MVINSATIGVGQDYTTIAAWIAATNYDLVTSGNIEIGNLVTNLTEDFVWQGATTDASSYRVLRADPTKVMTLAQSGDADGVTVSGFMNIEEDYTHLSGIKMDCIGVGNAGTIFVGDAATRTGNKFEKVGMFGLSLSGKEGFYLKDSTEFQVSNCFVHDIGGSPIYIRAGSGLVANCTLHWNNVHGIGSSACVSITGSAIVDVRNVIGTESGAAAVFRLAGSAAWGSGSRNNISSDAAVPGTNGQTSVAASSIYTTVDTADPVDLTPLSSGPADGSGVIVDAIDADDILGTARPQGSAWDVGYVEIIVVDTGVTPLNYFEGFVDTRNNFAMSGELSFSGHGDANAGTLTIPWGNTLPPLTHNTAQIFYVLPSGKLAISNGGSWLIIDED